MVYSWLLRLNDFVFKARPFFVKPSSASNSLFSVDLRGAEMLNVSEIMMVRAFFLGKSLCIKFFFRN